MRDITLNIDIRAVIKHILANTPRRGDTVILNDVIFREHVANGVYYPKGEKKYYKAGFYHTKHWFFDYFEQGSFETYELKHIHPSIKYPNGNPIKFNIVTGEQFLTFQETNDPHNVLVTTPYGVEGLMPKTLANLIIKYGNKDIKYTF